MRDYRSQAVQLLLHVVDHVLGGVVGRHCGFEGMVWLGGVGAKEM